MYPKFKNRRTVLNKWLTIARISSNILEMLYSFGHKKRPSSESTAHDLSVLPTAFLFTEPSQKAYLPGWPSLCFKFHHDQSLGVELPGAALSVSVSKACERKVVYLHNPGGFTVRHEQTCTTFILKMYNCEHLETFYRKCKSLLSSSVRFFCAETSLFNIFTSNLQKTMRIS